MMANPDYQTILAVLLRTSRNDTGAVISVWVSREYIYKQLFSYYHPSCTQKPKSGKPVMPPVQYKRGRKTAAALT
jgi:hypothetical protein